MDLVHHAVKVNAFLLFNFQTCVEQVHQKRFAAAHTAPNVETAGVFPCLLLAACNQVEQHASEGLLPRKAKLQFFEPVDDAHLGGVADMAFAAKAVLISVANIQSTLDPVFSPLLRHGKITLQAHEPPQRLLL